MGCFAKGCLTVLVLGFFLGVAILGTGWFIYKKTFTKLTSTTPSDVRIEAPTPEQLKSAQTSLDRLNEAIAQNHETTIAFTGPELTILLSRQADLDFLRDRSRIDISDSIMTMALSAPLDALPWPGLKGRWFNGTVRFSMSYDNGDFDIDVKSIEANGYEFPTSFLSSFSSAFDDSFNDGFRKETRRNNRVEEFWDHIKSIRLEGDKALVTTKGNLL